jgi:site-specific DNA-methyltransferase (adenine-specific)
MNTNTIHTGDCFEVLSTLPDESVHAAVTDPPYGLAFMGRDWDDFEPKEYQEWCEEWAGAVKRVLKPGGHLLAFSGNRTHHRLFTGVEDAGFEIRDTLTWHYGSGFPKASDISKTVRDRGDSAEKWHGWKTGLKPATEFVVMARKPYDGATVDAVLEHGTGALNIDGCRVEGGERPDRGGENNGSDSVFGQVQGSNYATGTTTEGRYPANVVFDETAADALDAEVGELSSGTVKDTHDVEADTAQNCYGEYGSRDATDINTIGDSGGPSRYFYTSKASRSERTEGGAIDNDHPTVKPLDLAEWLIRLVTREGQVVLDPFAGSGTIPKAAKGLSREFVGVERQEKYADIARVRCGLTPDDPTHVRADDQQAGLEDW